MAQKKVYDEEFKIQAVKLGREIGFSKAAKELGINTDTNGSLPHWYLVR